MWDVWKEIWKWAIDNYIFHAVIVISIFFLIFFPGRLYRLFGKIKKVKAGPFELQTGEKEEIDPNTPCPYKKSRDITFGALRDVDSKVDRLSAEMREIMAIVKNMSIDQQKSSFYDEHQPDAERLAAGLKYIYQGGNGFTKPDVAAFAGEHKDIYNALTRVKPELRLSRE